MATSKLDSTDLKTTCAMCSETFKSPKILPCLHTFCEQCINDFIVSFAQKKDNTISNFPCPLCKTVVSPVDKNADVSSWADTLPKNIVMDIIVSKATTGVNPDCYACRSGEEKSEAKFWCEICNEALCDQCNLCHSRLRLLRNHKSVPIDDIAVNNRGIYINAIDIECKEHCKVVEHFCSNHQQFCCSFCLKSEHNECTIVESTKDMSSENQNIHEKLKELKESFQQMLTSKQEQKDELCSHVKNIEKEAETFVNDVKHHVDTLFEIFRKQLNIFHEEENTKLNIRQRLLEEFIKGLDHWISITESVQKSGSYTQFAVQIDITKRQLNSAIDNLCKNFESDCKIVLKFHENQIANDLKNCTNNIGSFVPSYSDTGSPMKPIYYGCKCLSLKYSPRFEDISCKFKKRILLVGCSIKCGVDIDKNVMVVGDVNSDYKRVHLVNKDNGIKIHTVQFEGDIRRMCYDIENTRLYISNGTKKVFTADFQTNKLSKSKTFNFTNACVGALALSNGRVFTATNGGIKQFIPCDDAKELTECFQTNSSYGHYGLKIHDGNVIFTTPSNEVKKSSIDGNELFCIKNSDMFPISLAVLPTGSILILDSRNNGKLRIVSIDGRRHKILLEKFENVKSPNDVWIGADGNIIYVCGGQYIDVYEIISI